MEADMTFTTYILAPLAMALFATQSFAHFIFILPPTDAQPARVVLSDTPVIDPKATAEGLALKSANLVRTDGQKAELKLTVDKATGTWTLPKGESLTGMVTTSLDYGVVNRGEGERHLIRHHAKLVVDLAMMPMELPVLPLDIAPRRTADGVNFLVTVGGKPLPNVELMIHEPGHTKMKVVKTDLSGFTPNFTTTGEYAARVGYSDPTPGEFEGRRHRGTKHYSTLMLTMK